MGLLKNARIIVGIPRAIGEGNVILSIDRPVPVPPRVSRFTEITVPRTQARA